MINASLIDQGSHFPIGGLMVKIPVLPRVGDEVIVDKVKFWVSSITHRLETGPMSSYRALIYLCSLEDG